MRGSNGHFLRALNLRLGRRPGHAGAAREDGLAIAAAEHLRIIGNFRHLIASAGVTYPAPDGDYKAGKVLDGPMSRQPLNTVGHALPVATWTLGRRACPLPGTAKDVS